MSCEPRRDQPSCVGVVDKALALERAGNDVIHLEKGEPDFPTPPLIVDAAVSALRHGHTTYTTSIGLIELREAICASYQRLHGVTLNPSQVIVNSGSSPALLTAFLTALAPGDEVVLPDPTYPSYRRLIELAGAKPVPVPLPRHNFHYTAAAAADAISPATKAVIVNFPSNPLGATATADTLKAFADLGPLIIADEVYHGLSHDDRTDPTILAATSNAVVVNSFSKAFAMTGWRLGYAILPPALLPRATLIHQDSFVCANAFVQRAAIETLHHADEITEGWRQALRQRRDQLLDGLLQLGFEVPYRPDGAFYVFAKLPPGHTDSYDFAAQLLDHAHVAITPGPEFGDSGDGYVRFSYATPLQHITDGLHRIAEFLTHAPAPRRTP